MFNTKMKSIVPWDYITWTYKRRRRPRSRWRLLLRLRRSGTQVRASQVAIGQPSAHDLPHHVSKPHPVVHLPVIEPEYLFVQVRLGMEGVDADG